MAFEQNVQSISLPAAADLSGNQYYAGAINSSGQVALASAVTDRCGIIMNKPKTSGTEQCQFAYAGVVQAIAAGAINPGGAAAPATSGKVQAAVTTNRVMGICLASAATSANDIFPLFLTGLDGTIVP